MIVVCVCECALARFISILQTSNETREERKAQEKEKAIFSAIVARIDQHLYVNIFSVAERHITLHFRSNEEHKKTHAHRHTHRSQLLYSSF